MVVTETRVQPLIGLVRTMRPRQWTKNAIIYAGIVFDGQLFVLPSLLRVTAAFVLLCLVASSIYIINDLADIESDRKHPRKRNRPLASGQLPIPVAWAAAIVLPAVVLVLSVLFMGRGFTLIMVGYFVLHVLYSFVFKHMVIVDILSVTAGFVLRVAAGVAVISVQAFSPWLYACTALLALFLIVGKRRQELLLLAEEAGDIRVTLKHYNLPLLDDMLRMVMTATLVCYLIYTIEAPSVLLAGNPLTLLTTPFVLFALFRYLYLIHVEGEGSAPDEVLLKDRPLQIAILLWGLTFVAIIYFIPRVVTA